MYDVSLLYDPSYRSTFVRSGASGSHGHLARPAAGRERGRDRGLATRQTSSKPLTGGICVFAEVLYLVFEAEDFMSTAKISPLFFWRFGACIGQQRSRVQVQSIGQSRSLEGVLIC